MLVWLVNMVLQNDQKGKLIFLSLVFVLNDVAYVISFMN
jgi:hypothetical protein